jgi:hypothetical protein
MLSPASRRPVLVTFVVAAVAAAVSPGCRAEQEAAPLATPSLVIDRERVPLGSVLEMTYRFVVAPDARFDEDYRVFVHFLDFDEELLWDDDHDPLVPTTRWKPGETIEYTRTLFVPVYPYVGDASIHLGLHSTASEDRVPLAGDHMGQFAYKVASLQLTPQSDNIFMVFKEGWQQPERAGHNTEWHWTKKEATIAFKNPGQDCVLYLDLDNPGGVFREEQQVTVTLNGEPLTTFSLVPKQAILRKVALPAEALGSEDVAEIRIGVDKTFVPAQLDPSSPDTRELGIRVFHAFVGPAPKA